MSKYFYADPLKAAWMAKEFGIKFGLGVQDKRDNISYWSVMPIDDSILTWPKLELNTEQFNIRYFINSNSEVMLSPQLGDIIEFHYPIDNENNKQICMVVQDSCLDIPVYEQGLEIDWIRKHPEDIEEYKIIQRDDKAFFMPEIENN